jgi:hypothetical protein
MCDTIVSVSEHGVDPPSGEQATVQAEEALAPWTEAVQRSANADRRPAYIRRYWAKRDRRAGMPASGGLPADRPTARPRIA